MYQTVHWARIRNSGFSLLTIAALAGCLSDEDTDEVATPEPPPPANSAPQISGSPPSAVEVGESYAFTPSASDADGDLLTFSISNRPSWASFEATSGRLSGTPTLGNVGTESGIVISVSDGTDTTSLASFSITVSSGSSNSPPTISGTPPASVTAGQPYIFTPTANDADGDSLTFAISNQPAWANFSSANGSLSGAPGEGDVGTYQNIVISVTDGTSGDALPPFSVTVSTGVTNSAPTISGTPAASVSVGQQYSFSPTANDTDGDTLTFSVSGQPAWATFSETTGQLEGTPAAGDVGVYDNIVISVTDGVETAELPVFSIAVDAISLGSAQLSWTAPTENEDGSALTDLAGFKIYWGTTPGNYSDSATIDNPSVTTFTVDNLAPGTYEFVATAFNTAGVESQYSVTATKTIQ